MIKIIVCGILINKPFLNKSNTISCMDSFLINYFLNKTKTISCVMYFLINHVLIKTNTKKHVYLDTIQSIGYQRVNQTNVEQPK